MKKTPYLVLVLVLFCLPVASNAREAVVSGVLMSRMNGMGAPGLTVSLVHPNLGRSMPAISDLYGRYMFYGIPIMPTPYYIEVYWGFQLVYRNMIMVSRPNVEIPPILF
jgi:hypothetical protein